MHCNPFSDDELARRLAAVRAGLAERKLDAVLLSSPENIFYLTGLDHWGYFAPHILIVPLERPPVLITRAMEKVAVDNMVRNAVFRGHHDSESAAVVALEVLRELGLAGKHLGLEAWSAGLSFGLGQALQDGMDARWQDVTGWIDLLRQVKSPEEQDYLRLAAKAADGGTLAAIEALHAGAKEEEVAAAALAGMTRAGGEPPGFGPFIRPGARLGEEHTTWGHGRFPKGERVFLEIAGCRARYQAPNGRLVHIGDIPEDNLRMAELSQKAFAAACGALRPGSKASEVYQAWQDVVDAAGLAHYRRHHCGYVVGIAFPPSWTGGNTVTGLRPESQVEIRTGMSFHLMSWLMGTGKGDFFISNCVLLGEAGPEVLTTSPHVIAR